jgi:hypothetical protein
VHTRQIGPSLLHFPLRCGRQNSPPQTRHFPPSTGRNGLRHAAHVNDRLTTRSSHSRAKVARYCGRRPMAKPGTSRPELIDTGRNKRFAKPDASGRFKAMDDVRRSLSADRRRTAKKASKPGDGDKGDRPVPDHPDSAARRWHLDRSDRAVARYLSREIAGRDEERRNDLASHAVTWRVLI